jgi:hypothetical protein
MKKIYITLLGIAAIGASQVIIAGEKDRAFPKVTSNTSVQNANTSVQKSVSPKTACSHYEPTIDDCRKQVNKNEDFTACQTSKSIPVNCRVSE